MYIDGLRRGHTPNKCNNPTIIYVNNEDTLRCFAIWHSDSQLARGN